MKRARGYDVGDGRKRIVITLEADSFETIAALARQGNSSFSEMAATVIEWGIESAQQENRPADAA